MSVIPDVVNIRTQPDAEAKAAFRFRLDAAMRVKRMRDVYMNDQEAAFWDSGLIYEVLWSLPDEDIETLNSIPNEDVRSFFDDMVMDLVYAKNVINTLMG
jgi:hypothetical protein